MPLTQLFEISLGIDFELYANKVEFAYFMLNVI